MMCLPSMTPRQCDKFHLFSNDYLIFFYSCAELGDFKNPLSLSTFHLTLVVSLIMRLILVGLILKVATIVTWASPATTYGSAMQSLSSGLIASRLTFDFNIRGATQSRSCSSFQGINQCVKFTFLLSFCKYFLNPKFSFFFLFSS